MVDALEEVGLAIAIADGRNNDFVSEAEIFSILNGEESADKILGKIRQRFTDCPRPKTFYLKSMPSLMNANKPTACRNSTK